MMNDPIEIERIRRKHFPEFFGDDVYFLPRSMSIRQAGKKGNHGLNYMEGENRFALQNEIDASEAKKIIHYYTRVAYPGINLWWEAVKRQLKEDQDSNELFREKENIHRQMGT